MEQLKIAIVQLKGTINIKNNFNKHITYIKAINSDLILFPECSLLGYDIENIKKYKKNNEKYEELLFYHKELVNFIKKSGKTVIFGSILKDNKGNLYNSAFVVSNNLMKVYKKISLTEEEEGIFKKGNRLIHFELKRKRIAPIICRDQSNIKLFTKLKNKGVDVVLILSAHYYGIENINWKKYKNIAIPITRAIDFNISVIKANSIGIINNKLSHGNSLAVNKNGKLITLLDDLNEQFIEITLS
jgi:predicted amidohydrolase